MEKDVSYQPPLIMSPLEKGDEGAGHHPSCNIQAPEWCKCGQCREMPTEVEIKCCGYVPKNCLSKEPANASTVDVLFQTLANSNE